MAGHDDNDAQHRATYSGFVRLTLISSVTIAIALGLMAIFLL
jgi:hypothetical protein